MDWLPGSPGGGSCLLQKPSFRPLLTLCKGPMGRKLISSSVCREEPGSLERGPESTSQEDTP